MASHLPQVTGREAIRAFGQVGYLHVRTNGSHYILKRDGHPLLLSVPVHGNKAVRRGTLKSLIADAGLTTDGFAALLKT